MTSRVYNHDELPQSVVSLLETGKFVHLGTADLKGMPEVTLMNYYYLPSHELYTTETIKDKEVGPVESSNSHEHTYIIFSTRKTSQKYKHLQENPHVSLLFHDWTTAKNLYKKNDTKEDQSNLFKMLQDLNQTELSQISATLSGNCKVITDDDELKYYKTKLLKENPDASVYIEGDDNSIVLVQITSAKVCDSENNTSTYQ